MRFTAAALVPLVLFTAACVGPLENLGGGGTESVELRRSEWDKWPLAVPSGTLHCRETDIGRAVWVETDVEIFGRLWPNGKWPLTRPATERLEYEYPVFFEMFPDYEAKKALERRGKMLCDGAPTSTPRVTATPKPTATRPPTPTATSIPAQRTALANERIANLPGARLWVNVLDGRDTTDPESPAAVPRVRVSGPFYEDEQGPAGVLLALAGDLGGRSTVTDFDLTGLLVLLPAPYDRDRYVDPEVIYSDRGSYITLANLTEVRAAVTFDGGKRVISLQCHKQTRLTAEIEGDVYACVARGDTPYW